MYVIYNVDLHLLIAVCHTLITAYLCQLCMHLHLCFLLTPTYIIKHATMCISESNSPKNLSRLDFITQK